MTDRLIRLFPADWRARYGDELMALLAERPPTIRDRIDLARGALDARVHPQLRGDLEPMPITHRIPGLLALGAGLMWLGGWVAAVMGEDSDIGGLLIGLALMVMFIGLPGDYMADHVRPMVRWGIVAGAAFVLGGILPWELKPIPGLVFVAIVGGGMLTLAGLRARFGSTARWSLLLTAVCVPITVVAIVGSGLVAGESIGLWAMVLMLELYGLAWTLVGALMIVRGAPTLLPPPGRGGEAVA